MGKAREHFEAAGKLSRCPSPMRFFQIRRLLVGVRVAKSWSWSHLDDKGDLHTDWVSIGVVEKVTGTKALAIKAGKMYLMVGILPKKLEESRHG